jgi:hypothetical protein
MKRKALAVMLVLGLLAGTASAQFGFGGIVYDPTNYHNALLRYFQLEQQLIQLRNSYAQLVEQYQLARRMARNIENMPARYRALFSPWRNIAARDVYGNTGAWTSGANSGEFPRVAAGYEHATTQLLEYDPAALGSMTRGELERIKSQYASVELADGANTTALATIGSIRGNARTIENRISNLEEDSLSGDPNLNTEVSVLNKINAANVLTLRTVQDSNKLLASLVEQQTILSKQQREATANAINGEIARRAHLEGNLSRLTSTLTDSLENFRMP